MNYGVSAEAKMNLSALQRVDPYANRIVQTAGHVALYSFNADSNVWQKTNIEGTLHVYARSAEPLHSVMIMNRLNTNNLTEPIETGLDLQLQVPFLLYRNGNGTIYGIWFYDKDECTRISTMLKSLIKHLIPKQNDTSTRLECNPTRNIDLVSMLSKAQEDYRANKIVSKGIGTSSLKNEEDAPPQCVMEFFAKAGSGKRFSDGLPPLSSYAGSQNSTLNVGSKDNTTIHKPIDSPIHTVEQIEMRVRSLTPTIDVPVALSVSERVQSVNQCSIDNTKPKHSSNQMTHCREENDMHIHCNGYHQSIENQYNKTLIEQFLNANESFIEKSEIAIDSVSTMSKEVESQVESEDLMPPTRFIMEDFEDELVTSSVSAVALDESKPLASKLEPLTKNQLLQAFDYLLKNDPEFMLKIHEAYVKSLLRN
ncbi:mRNA-decapping enzyme 1B-like [Daktulosphaira vitifoliae]|uniref:mRNA-decapping enzyme 1B-like n=1 Tax=Daktulosphaira vitifoliae TaxID=58002 RepID=UPI0021AA9E2B|nr:mRNA-decapping enzyme 1B-like [Daktulosphaira vitifoliae]